MPFTLSLATEEDCEALVRLQFEACAHDPAFSTIFPRGAAPETVAHYVEHMRNDMRANAQYYPVKIINSEATGTDEIVGFAFWYILPERPQDEVDADILSEDVDLPSDANHEAGKVLITNGNRKRREIMGGEPYIYLASVGTSAKYRRRGLASLSLEWVTKMADERKLPCYVEGTPSGISVYEKNGFKIVDRLKLDLDIWKDGDFWNVCMIRPAKS